MKVNLKSKSGITLVALIITIIVLLILAMVSIRLVMNRGIIDKANKGVNAYNEAEVKEKIQLAYSELEMAKFTNSNLDETQFLKERLEAQGLTGVDIQATSDGWNITYNGKSYPLSKSGIVGDAVAVIDWDTVIANAQKHPDQSATNDEIGIDMHGNPVNLDLWFYEFDEENQTFITGKGYGSQKQVGYVGNIVNGKIIEEIPQYIKKSNIVYILTAMSSTFSGCTSLTTAPAIPSSVTNMSSTFSGCTSLTTAPTIPSSVTNMSCTFYGCTSLTTAPTIPSSVTNMSSTFNECTSLTTAPTIPNSVTNMSYSFSHCDSLINAPVIPSSVIDMSGTFNHCISLINAPIVPSSVSEFHDAFWHCSSLKGNLIINAYEIKSYNCSLQYVSTNEDCNLVVSGTCPQLDDIIATKSENSHITKGQ